MQPLYAELSDVGLGELLKTHRRNHEILAQQVAGFGKLHVPVHQLTGLDDEQSSLKAVLAEYKRRGATPPPPERSPDRDSEQADPGRKLLQPSRNIRNDMVLARALVRRGDNPERARSTLDSILLAESAQGEAWHLLGRLLDDPAERAIAEERAALHGYSDVKKRKASDAIMWGLLSLAMLMLGALIVISWLEASQRGRLAGGISIVTGAGLLVFACMAFYFLANFQEDWTRQRRTAERARRRGYLGMCVGILGMVLFILLGAAWAYRRSILGLPIPADSINNLLLIGGFTFVLSVVVGPLALVEVAPELALSRGLGRVFNAGVVLMGLMLVGLVAIGRAVFPWPALAAAATIGLTLIWATIFAYRRGISLFDAMLDLTGSNIKRNKPPR